jgi:peptidoglycan hydrolase CwlO-like protein
VNERTLDGRMNQLHQQISNLESQKKECENLSDEMKEKIDNLTGQIVLIRKVAESKQADNDKLCSENKNLNIKVEELNEKLVTSETAVVIRSCSRSLFKLTTVLL